MNFVFPMGGLSSRFTKAGFKRPKFELDVFGATVFEHAVIGFHRYFKDHTFVFVYRGGAETTEFIRSKCLGMGIPVQNLKMVLLEHVTSGQAETVRIAINKAGILPSEAITIFNIDTFQTDYVFPDIFDIGAIDGYLEVFIAPGDHWSFIEPGDNNVVKRVTEKDRISEYCSSGLYHFRHSATFSEAFDATLSIATQDLAGGERYVAPLYNQLIANSLDIRFNLVGLDQLTFCGTPDEYANILHSDPPPTSRLLLK